MIDRTESLLQTAVTERSTRLRSVMRHLDVPAVLTADPINIAYATGVRNMTIFSQMGASRFLLFAAEGPSVLWEFAGAEHLAAQALTDGLVHDIRSAPGVTPLSGPRYVDDVSAFASEICSSLASDRLGVERCDHPITDALRGEGLTLSSATEVFIASRLVKTPAEIAVMNEAMQRVETGVESLRTQLEPGATENEVWSALHQHLIATDGEYISTRLAQSGPRTFPYFQEASDRVIQDGDLFCLDTDALGFGGYGVDFSRTFRCGDGGPSEDQSRLHALALDQLQTNGALLAPGTSFEGFARSSWAVPERHAPFGYYCLAHGLGLSGEYPYVPQAQKGEHYAFDGEFEPGMVICVESYIGDAEVGEGVKLEDQFLITESGARRMSSMPHELR